MHSQYDNYNVYYNNRQINKADGVAMFIIENLLGITQIDNIDEVKILSSNIKLKNDAIIVFDIYRCHRIEKNLSHFNISS